MFLPEEVKITCNFDKLVLSIFFKRLLPPSLSLMAAEGWGKKEICIEGAVDSQI